MDFFSLQAPRRDLAVVGGGSSGLSPALRFHSLIGDALVLLFHHRLVVGFLVVGFLVVGWLVVGW